MTWQVPHCKGTSSAAGTRENELEIYNERKGSNVAQLHSVKKEDFFYFERNTGAYLSHALNLC